MGAARKYSDKQLARLVWLTPYADVMRRFELEGRPISKQSLHKTYLGRGAKYLSEVKFNAKRQVHFPTLWALVETVQDRELSGLNIEDAANLAEAKLRAEVRSKTADAIARERKNEEADGDLIRFSNFGPALRETVLALRGRIENLGADHSAQLENLSASEIMQILEAWAEETLLEYSADLDKLVLDFTK